MNNGSQRGRKWVGKCARLVVLLSLLLSSCQSISIPFLSQVTYRRLTVQDYRNKMMAGWLGQMVGVAYGSSTEFSYLNRTIPVLEIPKIGPGLANQSFGQDDLYVEMTFLHTLETYGLDVSSAQAGIDFANSQYPLWHANNAGRMNLRSGIAPPDSGHPAYNSHADDIDYQIESDFAGLISPGLPNQAIGLGNTFGSLMNYGDGLYGGLFFSCMYSEAFFESEPQKIVEAGLACIPVKSQYAEAIRDVVNWWQDNPQDWQATWHKVQDKYQNNPDYRRYSCSDPYFDDQFNIDAKINGAYAVMGMLYGAGDPIASMTIAMRAGQDSDCNPSSAGGVIYTTLGWDQIPDQFKDGLDRQTKWDYTEYNFDSLVALCEKLARDSVIKAGGKIETDSKSGEEVFLIPEQKARPGSLEQSWQPGPLTNAVYSPSQLQTITAGSSRLAQAVPQFAPGWRLTSCIEESLLGQAENVLGRPAALMLQAQDYMPCTLANRVTLPADQVSQLHLELGSMQGKQWQLVVRVNGQERLSKKIGQSSVLDPWETVDIDLAPFQGKTVLLEVSNMYVRTSDQAALGLISELSIQPAGKTGE